MKQKHTLLLVLADNHPAQKTRGPVVELQVDDESNLLDTALAAGVGIQTLCGGARACRTCRVFCDEGVSAASSDESDVLEEMNAAPGERLACQVHIVGDARVRVPFLLDA